MQEFIVELRDRVEVGANCIIDRGTWRDTVVDKGAMIDSLVHLGGYTLYDTLRAYSIQKEPQIQCLKLSE